MQCLTVIKPSTFVGRFPCWLVPSGPTQMQQWKVWRGCGAMCRTVTMVTNVTNCHVTTHSVSPFPRLLKFSPPPLPSGASVLVSASDSEGGLGAGARERAEFGLARGGRGDVSSPADSVDKTFEKQRVQIWCIFILSNFKPQSVKKQTDADLRVCDIYLCSILRS